MLIEACQRAGLIVVLIAHDGDRFGDKYHLRTFKSYAECDRCESLEAVVDYLEGLPQNAFVCFHIPDPLHLFKNDRQRLRNRPLALLPDEPSWTHRPSASYFHRRWSPCRARAVRRTTISPRSCVRRRCSLRRWKWRTVHRRRQCSSGRSA
jgi:hypothetical protein